MYIRCINYYPYLSLHLSLSDGNWVRPISHHPFPRYKLNHPLISHMGSWQSEYTYVASKANQSTFNDIWMRRLILRDAYVAWYESIAKELMIYFCLVAQAQSWLIISCFPRENYSFDWSLHLYTPYFIHFDAIYGNIF